MNEPRACGPCSLCCTVLRVDELRKLGGTPCVHQRGAGGCGIYATRPAICRAYQCLWLRGALGDDDRPDRLGAVLDVVAQGASSWLEIREASPGSFERSARLRAIAEEYRRSMPVRIGDVADVLDPERRFRVLLPGGEERVVEGEWTTLRRVGAPDTRVRLPRLERWLRRVGLYLRRRRVAGYRGAGVIAFALTLGLGACATSGSEVPALVGIETTAPPAAGDSRQGIHVVTVAQDGSVERRLHHWRDDARTRRKEPQILSPEQLAALRDVLATPPVAVDQSGIPFEATEFRITAHGAPEWSAECYETEVHRCPIPFVKLWQSLDEIIGGLPQR